MNDTIQLLLELKMSGSAQKLEAQYHEPNINELNFEERLKELLLAEQSKRHNSKIDRLIKSARFRYPHARLEDIDYSKNRQIDRKVINNLASCEWINANRGVLIMGPAGVGKTWLASALGVEACRHHYSAYFISAKALFEQVEDALFNKQIASFIKKVSKKQLLIIDDFCLGGIDQAFSSNLLDIIDAQQDNGGLIITSQFTPDVWFEQFEDSAIADATLDRIVHRSQQINARGESIKKVKA